ncbi:MAG: potassium channel family protein [Ginsengibacter sp.]
MENENKTVLILGSGHLAYRVKKLVEVTGYETIHFSYDSFQLTNNDGPTFNKIADALNNINLSSLSMIYILNERDDYNLELMLAVMSLNKHLPITVSLFNENVAPHLQAAHSNLHILNPAKIAAPAFVEALYKPVERILNYMPVNSPKEVKNLTRSDYFIKLLVGCFAILIILATAYFHFFETLSWLDAFYFVMVTVATVGYGDINLLNASAASKIIGIILILSATVFIWMIFSLTIDQIIKRRVQLALGRKKYHHKNHIIICGLGRLGYFIAEALIKRQEKIVIVESNENSAHSNYFRSHGVDVYIGDAGLTKVLQDVGVANAQAVISVINNDYTNLEIGLNARSLQPKLRLILRIFDESMAQIIKEKLDIYLTLSMSAFADEKFVETLKG